MNTIRSRVERMENRLGADDDQRRIRAMTDEELEASIAALMARVRADLVERGIDHAGLNDKATLALYEQHVAAPEAAENNQGKSNADAA